MRWSAGFLFPAGLIALRQHYVTKLRLSDDLSSLEIETYDSVLPRSRHHHLLFDASIEYYYYKC